jgi:glycosyltransferase involved in cell wall biosynthesis
MDKITRIVFFSAGFAFNRLVRMRFYETIFPKSTELYLVTTDKYKDSDKWILKRTKIIVLENNPLKNIFEIRKICQINKIETLSNLGHPFGAIPLIIATFFQKRNVLLYILGDSIDYPKIDTFTKSGLRYLFSLIPYFFIEKFCKKTALVGYNSYLKAPVFFLSPKKKFYYMHAPTDTKIFHPITKSISRKKTSLKENEKIILYVGRITRRKGGQLLKEIILSNPNIKFILIGKWIREEIAYFKSKNLIHIESVDNDKLPEFYSAADLTFAYHRQGCQMGIVGAESLACGTPILHTKRIAFKDSPAILKFGDNLDEVNKKIKTFFDKDSKEIKSIRKEARNYAEKYCSNEIWKSKYLDFYLR